VIVVGRSDASFSGPRGGDSRVSSGSCHFRLKPWLARWHLTMTSRRSGAAFGPAVCRPSYGLTRSLLASAVARQLVGARPSIKQLPVKCGCHTAPKPPPCRARSCPAMDCLGCFPRPSRRRAVALLVGALLLWELWRIGWVAQTALMPKISFRRRTACALMDRGEGWGRCVR
jgi:hypothetical protein